MAVSINIPGIGTVSAPNAASESTLQGILAAVQQQTAVTGSVNRTAGLAFQTAARAGQQAATSMAQAAGSAQQVAQATAQQNNSLNSIIVDYQQTNSIFVSGMNAAGRGVRNLALTLTDIAGTLVTSYRSMQTNSIGASAQLLTTGIDLVTNAIGTGAPLIGGALGTAFGPGGTVVGAIIGNVGGKAAEVVGEGLKVANNIMSQELQASVESFAQLNSAGLSFANGMSEMRIIANESGMTIDQFTSAVQQSQSELRNIGGSMAGAAQKVAEVSSVFDENGGRLRREMLALGYGFEEQYKLTAQYSAMMVASNGATAMRNMSEKELAQGTRRYAEDLKVLAAFTKEDAQAAMEAARARSMEADIMAQLGPEEAQKFQKMLAALPEGAKKGFMEYVSSGGTVITDQATNIAMAQNAEYEQLIKGGYERMMDAGTSEEDAMDFMLEQRARAGEMQREMNREQGNQIAQVARLTGAHQDAANLINEITADGLYDPQAVAQQRETASIQAKAVDEVTKSAIDLQTQTQSFAREMENAVLPYMSDYAKLLATVNGYTLDFGKNMLQMVTGQERTFDGEDISSREINMSPEYYEAERARISAIENEEERKAAEAEFQAQFLSMMENASYQAPEPVAVETGFSGGMVSPSSMQQIASSTYGIYKEQPGPELPKISLDDTQVQMLRDAIASGDSGVTEKMNKMIERMDTIGETHRLQLARSNELLSQTADRLNTLAREV